MHDIRLKALNYKSIFLKIRLSYKDTAKVPANVYVLIHKTIILLHILSLKILKNSTLRRYCTSVKVVVNNVLALQYCNSFRLS